MTMESQIGLIAFGSNQGDSEQIFADAANQISKIKGVDVERVSRAYWTKPVKGKSDATESERAVQSPYLNAVIKVRTTLEPQQLLAATADIEREYGRVRKQRWDDRTIDLDLLLLGDQIVESEGLTLPHPRMSFRRFVLEPAAEVASNLIHPIANCTIHQLFKKINSHPKTMGIACSIGQPNGLVVDEVVEKLAKCFPTWTFKKIFSEKIFSEIQQALTILVLLDPPNELLDEAGRNLQVQTKRFAGPYLRLNPEIAEIDLMTEVQAAIQTIG